MTSKCHSFQNDINDTDINFSWTFIFLLAEKYTNTWMNFIDRLHV